MTQGPKKPPPLPSAGTPPASPRVPADRAQPPDPGDTVPLHVLTDANAESTVEIAVPGVDPYRSERPPGEATRKPPHRTLDDMRRLSEEIKQARGAAPTSETEPTPEDPEPVQKLSR